MFRRHGHFGSVVAILAALGTPAFSQTVTIETVDGNISLQGTILSFDGENYDFDSAIGRTTIPAALVVCRGDACPQIDDGKLLNATVSVLDKPSKSLLMDLVQAFAEKEGISATPDIDGLTAASFAVRGDSADKDGELVINETNQREGFEALLNGETQFLFSTAAISNELAEEFVAAGKPDLRAPGREVVVALDAIVPSVHASNVVRDLPLPVIAQIAAGRIRNWNEIGGADAPIRMVLPDDDSSIAALFDDRVMRPNRLRLSRTLERVGDEAAAAAIVAEDENAITVTSASLAEGLKELPLRQVCGPLSVPTDFAIKAEEYPLARRLFLYTSEATLSQSVKEFLSYAGSAEAQSQFGDFGFFGQTVENVPMTLQGARLASAILQTENPEVFEQTRGLMQTLTLADRLSTTFRFEPGSTELDNKSRRDAVRVSEYLMQPENVDREILLFGFTDSVGRNDLNNLLSLQQAVKIKEAIISASAGQIAEDRIVVTSYGSIAPVGCNDTVEGRNSNRRVEVWLR